MDLFLSSPPLQDKRTPLHNAALEGHDNSVHELINANADVEAKDKVLGVQGLETFRN